MNNKKSISDSIYNYKQWREQFILFVLRASSVLGVVLIAGSFSTATAFDRVLFSALYLALLLITIVKFPYAVRAYGFLFMIYAIGVNAVLAWGPWLDGSIFFLGLIAMSSLLFDDRTDIGAAALSVITVSIIAVINQTGLYALKSAGELVTTWETWVAYIINMAIVSAILVAGIWQFKQEFARLAQNMQATFEELIKEREQLEERVSERTAEIEAKTAQMRSSTVIARTVAEIQNIDDLLRAITTLTTEQFGYYHIGLYLLDENKKTAFLQSASSEVGKPLIGQGFHIEPNRRNPLYLVVTQNKSHVSSDADGAQFLKDPNFPLTRSRMALPLSIRGKVMGILDIHSDQTRAFTAQDAETMQILADLAAISIDNVRLINEARNLVNQLEANTAYQTRETWSKLTSRHTPAYLYTPAGIRPIFSPKKSAYDGEDGAVLKVNLNLHGQSIGKIKLKRKGVNARWSERERELVEKIASQVSLALENSRLVDEAQKNALRDKMIANVSARVRETLDIESVIRTATTELRRVFDLKEAEINVGLQQSQES